MSKNQNRAVCFDFPKFPEVEVYRESLCLSFSLSLSIFSLYLFSPFSPFSLSSLTLHKLEHDAKAERIQRRGTELGEEAGSTQGRVEVKAACHLPIGAAERDEEKRGDGVLGKD